MIETGYITQHSGSMDLIELRSLHAYLNDQRTSELTNNKINRSIELLVNTFEALVELSLLHPQRSSNAHLMVDGGFFIDHTKELDVGYADSNVAMYFTIWVVDRKRPYLVHDFPLTEKHEEILYKHLKLKVKEKVKDKVTELTWN